MEKEKLVSLVTAAKEGGNDAMNELFNAFYNDIYYFALKTIKDDELALDITQESFVEIINSLGNLKEPAAFVTWAKQITYHQCTRYFKKKKDVLVEEDEEGNTVFDTLKEENTEFIPDEALDKSDFQKTILGILDELSEEQRSAVMMYYFDEMSVGQIAEIQGVSTGTVKSRLNYARKAIKESVEEYEKKNGIKLHAIGFFPMFKWLFDGAFGGGIPAAAAKTLAEGVTAATGAAVTATAATTSAVATTAATTTAVGIGAKIAAMPLAAKIIAGVVAAAITIGGATTAVVIANEKDDNTSTQSIVSTIIDDYDNSDNNDDDNNDNNVTDIPIKDENGDELILEGTIPEGCTYTLYDGTVLTAGQKFPESCTAGDKVLYGDYLYGYECIYAKNIDGTDTWYMWKDGFDSGDSGVVESDVFGSWSVMVVDQTKSTYGVIASKINGQPIKTLDGTFFGCINMTQSPKIPSTITAMPSAYWGCSSLVKAPMIPTNVERIMMSFKDCVSLTGDIEINATLDKSLEWYYSETFSGTKGKINLVGSTPEADLILIAKASDNPNITVNGKKVDYETDVPVDEEDDTVEPDKEELLDKVTLDDYVESVAKKYVSNRLLYSGLPYFSSVDELTMSNAFWFAFYGIDIEPDLGYEDEYGARNYVIMAKDFHNEIKNVFGREYDLTTLNEYDPTGTIEAIYPIAVDITSNSESADAGFITFTQQGGVGTDYHPEITKLTKLGDDKYQVDIAWYSGSSEKPTDENVDYYYNEATGDYWIADKWETMVLKTIMETVENEVYTRVRIVSYLAK